MGMSGYTDSQCEVTLTKYCRCYDISGAIIRDGDRKSWDARGPMI